MRRPDELRSALEVLWRKGRAMVDDAGDQLFGPQTERVIDELMMLVDGAISPLHVAVGCSLMPQITPQVAPSFSWKGEARV